MKVGRIGEIRGARQVEERAGNQRMKQLKHSTIPAKVSLKSFDQNERKSLSKGLKSVRSDRIAYREKLECPPKFKRPFALYLRYKAGYGSIRRWFLLTTITKERNYLSILKLQYILIVP